jgi:glycosyltransferase involved in cell wall biosynthesis
MTPRVGVLDSHPIQYHTPLYQRLASRGNVDCDVLFLSDLGYRAAFDPGFGQQVAWDIDLLSSYSSSFLTTTNNPVALVKRAQMLRLWLLSHDVIIVHGYVNPWMLYAMVVCRMHRISYLMRGESHSEGQSTGLRRGLRELVARTAVSRSAGGLAIGRLNDEFYRKFGAPQVTFAPYSVDDARFAKPPMVNKSDLLSRWGLAENRPVIIFCGKLIPRKRPLDLAAAIQLLPYNVNAIFIGDGSLADTLRASLIPGGGAVTGFVNQAELPSYYHAADILVLPSEAEPWGLVINEAMAAGVLPVVSDRVGAAPDLVSGLGEVYPCGDVAGLASALGRALTRINDADTRERVRGHVARYSLDRTADGFEHAATAVCEGIAPR